jgi:8-amino-7-oxononanoate synthase
MRHEQMTALLQQRQQAGLLRQLKVLDNVKGASLSYQGKSYLNFSGNDYLGLAADPAVVAALAQGAADYGVGSTGSPLISGQQRPHQQLCAEICDWLNVDAVMLFSSGFAANQAMLLGLCAEDDLLLLDKFSHASMIDAALQLPGGYKRFLHNDLLSLEKLLKAQQSAVGSTPPLATLALTSSTTQSAEASQSGHLPKHSPLVATEGVFSMDGDSPDLLALNRLCQQYQAPLLLDDAHGVGVHGEQGAGSLAQAGLATTAAQCLMANFGKALGGQGGFLACSQTVADYLTQGARHFIYSTALSPAMAVAMTTSVQRCRHDQWRRDSLAQNIQWCQQLAARYDLQLLPSNSAIQPLLIGDSHRALAVSQQLAEQGIWLSAIRSPTVPLHQARLRITLTALHKKADLEMLFKSLVAVL